MFINYKIKTKSSEVKYCKNVDNEGLKYTNKTNKQLYD